MVKGSDKKGGYSGEPTALPWAVLLQAKKDDDKLWHEFVATKTGKRYLEGRPIDSTSTAYDLGSYLWGSMRYGLDKKSNRRLD